MRHTPHGGSSDNNRKAMLSEPKTNARAWPARGERVLCHRSSSRSSAAAVLSRRVTAASRSACSRPGSQPTELLAAASASAPSSKPPRACAGRASCPTSHTMTPTSPPARRRARPCAPRRVANRTRTRRRGRPARPARPPPPAPRAASAARRRSPRGLPRVRAQVGGPSAGRRRGEELGGGRSLHVARPD